MITTYVIQRDTNLKLSTERLLITQDFDNDSAIVKKHIDHTDTLLECLGKLAKL